MISTFVFGERDSDHELQAWRQLPFLIDATPIASLLEREEDDEELRPSKYLRPLQAVSWPTRVDAVVDLTLHAMAPIGKPDRVVTAALIGFDTNLPLVETRVHLSLGGTTPRDELTPRLASRLELRRPLGLSIDGL